MNQNLRSWARMDAGERRSALSELKKNKNPENLRKRHSGNVKGGRLSRSGKGKKVSLKNLKHRQNPQRKFTFKRAAVSGVIATSTFTAHSALILLLRNSAIASGPLAKDMISFTLSSATAYSIWLSSIEWTPCYRYATIAGVAASGILAPSLFNWMSQKTGVMGKLGKTINNLGRPPLSP